MKDFIYNYLDSEADESYPDFFIEWDKAVSLGKKPGFYEPDELTEIIDIYLFNNQIKRADQAINYALRIYSDDDELIYEVLLLLNDYERWNDLLSTCEELRKDESDVWIDGHRLTALLHLGMEEDSFPFFKRLKTKYAENKEDLSVIYQAMGEALCDVDLYDSAIEVIQEAIDTMDEDINFYWLQLQCYVSLNCKEEVSELAEVIHKLDPLNAATWHRLGLSFQDIGDREKAIDAYEYAQSLGYDPEEILMNLIYVYNKNKNFNKALEKSKEYLNLYPDCYIVNMMAAKLSSRMGKWNDALKYVDEALKLTPNDEALYLYKSNFLLRLEEYKKAKLALIEGLKNTKDSEGYLSRKLSKLNNQYPDY
ncbi:MAG: tetratricopeptide repeat protein [Candidatus Azobacteroides sp.]|nr:tetratricopeptide repeat protein [Candidatus Azobacteroides sp.]